MIRRTDGNSISSTMYHYKVKFSCPVNSKTESRGSQNSETC